MQSVLLLGALGTLIVAPGLAAALLAYGPGQLGIVTRCAAVFGIGYAIAGGWAFVLSVTHVFWTYTYLPAWLASTVMLWLFVLRRAELRHHVRAIAAEVTEERIVLMLGGVILITLLVVRGLYLPTPAGPAYVYILNGIDIANSHGIPLKVLEDGQAWPPATDKVFLDAFTGVATLLDNEPLIIPGVLQWLAYAGAAIGLWAFTREIGLRRTGILLPVLMLANTQFGGREMTYGFDAYRAEDFGMAVAFCALALGVSAIRNGGRTRALMAAFVLAAASGSHLIPVVVVVMILCGVVAAELLRRGRERPRTEIMLHSVVFGGSAALLGLVLRLVAGGSFGLGGAANQSSYSVVHTQFDPTAWLYTGQFLPRNPPGVGHFYVPAGKILIDVVHAATGLNVGVGGAIAVLAVALVLGVAFLWSRTEIGAVGLAALGALFGITAIILYFSYRYHVWIEATFGIRRPIIYTIIGPLLLVLGIVEALPLIVGRRVRALGTRVVNSTGRFTMSIGRIVASAGAVLALALSGWLIATSTPKSDLSKRTTSQRVFTSWVRSETACGARFLLNQRSSGTIAALTGRFALDEGMGPFLRPNRLGYVVNLLLAVNAFFTAPNSHEALLRQHHINYVIWSKEDLLAHSGPITPSSPSLLDHAPFLQKVFHTRGVTIYHVEGSTIEPVSPLLKGPYLGCRRGPVKL